MTWPSRFLKFFREIERPLSVVLDAEGCREGWLQGELFRHFRTSENGFQTNYSCSGVRAKHDLYCLTPTEMLAEIKVYAKNFRGPTRNYVKRLLGNGALSREAIETLQPRSGSLLADMLRLMKLVTSSTSIERYLILVLQQAGNEEFMSEISALGVQLIVARDRLDSFQVFLFKI